MKTLLLFLALLGTAHAQATTAYVWSPARVLDAGTSTWAGADVLQCTAWIPEIGVTSATTIAWFVTAGLGGGGFCSIAIYNADGSSKLGSIDASDCSATGSVVGATFAFNLVAGTKYQVCTCENTNGGTFLATKSASGNLTALANALSVPVGAIAANNCTGANTPATTGMLSASNVNAPILIIATNTP